MQAVPALSQIVLLLALSLAYIVDWSGFARVADRQREPVVVVPLVNSAGDRAKPESIQRPTVARRVQRPPAMVIDPPRSAPPGLRPGPGQKVFRLAIPRISLKQAVVEGATAEVLAQGVTHYPSCGPGFPPPYCSPFEEVWPGEKGRVIIAGHRTISPRPFFALDKLRRGDEIFTITRWGTFRYLVTAKRVVAPGDRTVIVDGVRGRQLALVTCHPKFSASRRLIVYARLRLIEASTEIHRHSIK
jgi:LPXTG-site transpeptidase (sortase) family protein